MAAPTFIAAVSASVGNADDITLDISATSFQAGDLAIAVIAFGDTDGSGGVPAGWTRVSGQPVDEDVELQGELLFRFLKTGDSTFKFTGADTGAIAAGIAIYRGVDITSTFNAQGETIDTVVDASHTASSITTTADDTKLVTAYFLWYFHAGGTHDVATERFDVVATATGPSPDRTVAVTLGDEDFATAGITPDRKVSTPGDTGLGNNFQLALTPADGALTAFDHEFGTTQGRIQPVNFPNVSDSFAFCLGRDIPGQFHDLVAGDFIEVSQLADFDTAKIVRVTVRMIGAEEMPLPLRWKFSLKIDGTERVSQLLLENGLREAEFAANIEQLTAGNHTLVFRLELVSI